MKTITRRILPLVIVAASGTALHAQSVAQALVDFARDVRNYNIITAHDANLQFINNDVEGPLAIGGNLTVGGVPLVNLKQFNTSPDPTLYVQGTFTQTGGGQVQLNNGYASLPGMVGQGTYPYQGDSRRYQAPGTTGWLQVNSNVTYSASDPRTNPAPAGWNFSALYSSFQSISATLSSATASGTIAAANNQLTFSGASSGITVFNLDTNLLSGNLYNGVAFSSINMNIGANAIYVINLLNADGKTVFGANGINFNLPTAMAQHLLWNVSGSVAVSLGNGGQFYGSVLAPDATVSNALNTPIDGQIVAGALNYTNAEVHDLTFDSSAALTAIPEPATFATILGAAAFLGGWMRRRLRAA